jgi:hypothetical protein
MNTDELNFYFGTTSIKEIPEYEIVDLPDGLNSGRVSVTINGDDDESKYVKFTVFNKQIELNLFPNKVLISPFTKIVRKNDNSSASEFYAQSEPEHCHYLHANAYSTAAVSNCVSSEVNGLIFLPDDSFEILPLTGRLKAIMPEYELYDETRAITIIKIPHLVKRSTFNAGSFENDFVNPTFRHLNYRYRDRGMSYERPTVEIGLFFDEAFYKIFAPFFDYNKKKLDDFILSYVNGMQSLYHHNSLGRKIDFTIVYIEIMEKQSRDMPHANGERNELLDNFCLYQKKLNPRDDRTPGHWDMAVYISGLDFFAFDANGYKNG